MKFFIAQTIYFIYLCFFFILLVLMLGTPEIYLRLDLQNKGPEYTENIGFKYTEILNKKDEYVIKHPNETQKYSILILSFTIFFVLTAINIVMFFRKSYIIIPILTSSIISLCFYILIWFIPSILTPKILFELNTLNKLDLNSKILVLTPFGIIKILLFAFSNWYKIK